MIVFNVPIIRLLHSWYTITNNDDTLAAEFSGESAKYQYQILDSTGEVLVLDGAALKAA